MTRHARDCAEQHVVEDGVDCGGRANTQGQGRSNRQGGPRLAAEPAIASRTSAPSPLSARGRFGGNLGGVGRRMLTLVHSWVAMVAPVTP